jgi:hypothetical protein
MPLDGTTPGSLAEEYGGPQNDLLHVAAQFRELDKDGSTARLWRQLRRKWPFIDAARTLAERRSNGRPASEADDGAQAAGTIKGASHPQTTTRPKKSTQRGDAQVKIITALSEHHKYESGSCLNQDPIGVGELARRAKVAKSTASVFFQKQFEEHSRYKRVCRDAGDLADSLKQLRGEVTAHEHLYGRTPPGEGHDHDE